MSEPLNFDDKSILNDQVRAYMGIEANVSTTIIWIADSPVGKVILMLMTRGTNATTLLLHAYEAGGGIEIYTQLHARDAEDTTTKVHEHLAVSGLVKKFDTHGHTEVNA